MPLSSIQSRVHSAACAAQRSPNSVRLIAVSKVQPLERIRDVLSQGHRVFGENRVQEAESKWPAFRDEFGAIELHLVGPLQSNKVNKALDLFDVIHSVDRDSLAKKLATAVQARGRCPDLFVQVNTGNEQQKAGVLPEQLDSLITACRSAYDLPISGLMCIPPVGEDAKGHFLRLAEFASRHGLVKLSMGMSGDFETAIACGATHIRVGSAIFGERIAPTN